MRTYEFVINGINVRVVERSPKTAEKFAIEMYYQIKSLKKNEYRSTEIEIRSHLVN